MTIERGVTLVAVHLGIVDEEQINNMSYIFFEDVLAELGHKLSYDAIVNYAGNSFCKKLISRLGTPIVSTSANISGTPAPSTFGEITADIRNAVDYIVPESFSDSTDFKPSRIIKFMDDYNFCIVRE